MLLVNNVDLAEIVSSVKLTDSWNNGAASFVFSYPAKYSEIPPNGSTVIFTYGETNIFYGWVFRSKQDNTMIECTAYDQRRYLKAKNSIMRQKQTLSSFVEHVCASQGDRIRIGTLENTEVNLGKYLFDNKTYLDMIYQSIQDNLLLNGYLYTLRDNFGALELQDTYNLRLPLIIGDGSLAKTFSYTKSIDNDTYNYIKVAKDDEEQGVRDVYVVDDSEMIGKWGKLMLYDKVSADLNHEQLISRATRLLAIKNRETEDLTVECVGDTQVFAGNGVLVQIADVGLFRWMVVDSVTHEFIPEHTMKLKLTYGMESNGA